MKKTEKIEIRISPEDKEALARRAEAEGRPVSEVVRDLLDANGVTMATRPEAGRARWGPVVGALVGGLPLGAAAAYGATRDTSERFVRAQASLWLSPTGAYDVEATVPHRDLDGLTMTVPTREGTYRIVFDAEPRGDETHRVVASVCLFDGDDCPLLTAPSLDTSLGRGGRLVGAWGEDASATIRLFAVTVED